MKPELRTAIHLIIGAAVLVLALVLSFYVLTATVAILLRLAVVLAVACGVAYLVLPAEKRAEYLARLKGGKK